MEKLRVVFVPGNGGFDVTADIWYPYLQEQFGALGIEVIAAEEFPDKYSGHMDQWLPFIVNELGVDENTIAIGHSTGAVAAMRLAETTKLFGTVLVSGYHTDLGDAGERDSGYFDTPWLWDAIAANQHFIIQFASTDDHLVPIGEARHVRDQLHTEYHEFSNRGHFNYLDSFPELKDALVAKIQQILGL